MMEPEMPPKEVPSGLNSGEYYELGVKYKAIGWINQSKTALQNAIKYDEHGNVSQKAMTFLKTRLPLREVPQEAIRANIEGYNNLLANPKAAKQIWWRLTEEYPEFEWPFSNLASLLITEGDLAEAKKLLNRAIELNPCYINALLHLSNTYAVEMDFDKSKELLNRILELEPDNEEALKKSRIVDNVARLTAGD